MTAAAAEAEAWIVHEVEHARDLLDEGRPDACLRALREAERVATAQGCEAVQPLLAEVAVEAWAAAPPEAEPGLPRRSVVGAIWLAALAAGVVALAAANPAGALSLVALGGAFATLAYLVGSLVRETLRPE